MYVDHASVTRGWSRLLPFPFKIQYFLLLFLFVKESLAYANRKLKIPGEKILRDTKEERDQQNRLKEINQQLKNLEECVSLLKFIIFKNTIYEA